MEVSAKSGKNINEFFKELSYVVSGARKGKVELQSVKTSS